MENISTTHMSLEEYYERYDEQPFELLEGVIVPLSPKVAIHSVIIKRLMRYFMDYEVEHGGEAFSESAFVLMYDKNWVTGSREPDVMFYAQERLNTYRENTPDWAEKPFLLVPDLAIEVVSKNDKFTKISQKVDLYLSDGVKLVWVIDPQRQTVDIHEPDSAQHTRLTSKDTLNGGAILPDFKIELDSLFAGLANT